MKRISKETERILRIERRAAEIAFHGPSCLWNMSDAEFRGWQRRGGWQRTGTPRGDAEHVGWLARAIVETRHALRDADGSRSVPL